MRVGAFSINSGSIIATDTIRNDPLIETRDSESAPGGGHSKASSALPKMIDAWRINDVKNGIWIAGISFRKAGLRLSALLTSM